MSVEYDTDKMAADADGLPAHNRQMRRINVAISDVCQCVIALAGVSNQGRRADNAATLGGVAIGLRRAAYRAQFDTIEGFEDEEKLLASYRANKAAL